MRDRWRALAFALVCLVAAGAVAPLTLTAPGPDGAGVASADHGDEPPEEELTVLKNGTEKLLAAGDPGTETVDAYVSVDVGTAIEHPVYADVYLYNTSRNERGRQLDSVVIRPPSGDQLENDVAVSVPSSVNRSADWDAVRIHAYTFYSRNDTLDPNDYPLNGENAVGTSVGGQLQSDDGLLGGDGGGGGGLFGGGAGTADPSPRGGPLAGLTTAFSNVSQEATSIVTGIIGALGLGKLFGGGPGGADGNGGGES